MKRSPTKNFTWAEVACQRTGLVRVTPRFWRHMEAQQGLRDWWGGTLLCTGYRTPYHNAQEGGVGDSQHLLFFETTPDMDDRFAADLTPVGLRHGAGNRPEAIGLLADQAVKLGFTGIGLYDSWLHLDMRPVATRWDRRTGR